MAGCSTTWRPSAPSSRSARTRRGRRPAAPWRPVSELTTPSGPLRRPDRVGPGDPGRPGRPGRRRGRAAGRGLRGAPGPGGAAGRARARRGRPRPPRRHAPGRPVVAGRGTAARCRCRSRHAGRAGAAPGPAPPVASPARLQPGRTMGPAAHRRGARPAHGGGRAAGPRLRAACCGATSPRRSTRRPPRWPGSGPTWPAARGRRPRACSAARGCAPSGTRPARRSAGQAAACSTGSHWRTRLARRLGSSSGKSPSTRPRSAATASSRRQGL